jgi:type IV pilus assembly protein PilV
VTISYLSQRAERGATMIEILVAILIFSVGLLGIASTQTMGLTNTQSALNRSYATQLSYDLIDIMRLNPQQVAAGTFDGYITIDGTGDNPLGYATVNGCTEAGTGCTELELAEHELELWRLKILSMLPDGQARIDLENAAENIYRVTLTWQDIKNEAMLNGTAGSIAEQIAAGADEEDFENILEVIDPLIYRFELDFRP